MKGWLARLRYYVSDAAEEFRHSPGVNLLAMATLAAAVFVAGVTLLLLFNAGSRIRGWRSEVRLAVYLEDGIAPEARARLRQRLERAPGVASVEYVDKAEALARFRRTFGDTARLADRLPQNPLPESLEATMGDDGASAEVADALVRAFSGLDGVEEVRFDRAWIDRLEGALGLARRAGVGLAIVIFGAVAFVMGSVMRLAVHARREEIDIMLLVGATPALVRGPFLAAGFFQGLAGSVLAVALVECMRRLGLGLFPERPALVDLMIGRALSPGHAAALVGAGLLVSLGSAFFAARGPSAQKS